MCRTLARLAIAALTLCATEAKAIVVFDNFDPNGGFHSFAFNVAARAECADGTGLRSASRFTVTGSDVLLSSVTLPIGLDRFGTTEHRLRVRIAADAAGQPGATIEVLSQNQNLWAPYPTSTTTTLLSTAHPLLQSGTSYWIVTEPSSAVSSCSAYLAYHWHHNTTGSTAPHFEDVETGVPVDPWSGTLLPVPKAFRVEGEATVNVEDGLQSLTFALGSVGPMPFRESTTLTFSLPAAGPVSLVIYDSAGRRVRTLVSGALGAGRARQTWNGTNELGHAVPSGLYFAHMQTGRSDTTHKLLLVR